MVSPEPISSSKGTQRAKNNTLLKKGITQLEKERSITPQREEIPQRQLRSSTSK
jgi:hypothetical protein